MFSLLIETSTERGLAAILKEEKALFQGLMPQGHQNSKYLLPQIELGLKSNNLTVRDLTYIAVGIGPGSYTGIRVGVSAAQALAFAAGIPLIGICTLKTFIPDQDGLFVVLIDAKIGGAYVIAGTRQKGIISFSSGPQVLELEKLEVLLKSTDIIISPNISVLKPKLEKLYPQKKWSWQEKGPDMQQMGKLAAEMYKKGEYTRDGRLEILYLRKTQAELEGGMRKTEGGKRKGES